ncbi:uncharacterized protein UV8b_03559 [Ustilaginoidea virens]|uniref:Uncharacterized protein n=1 Tax=Ustilaginoidea virens TaxID=1159556 RepID=A0A8E5HQ05_USTVR|nr:uncharacterized protein UV8b_03559 [Ustilaginoidea virens]QUC19318.1 hypothetical protein UV8b_03559 [Ustilaginoidea virens]
MVRLSSDPRVKPSSHHLIYFTASPPLLPAFFLTPSFECPLVTLVTIIDNIAPPTGQREGAYAFLAALCLVQV